MENVCTCGKLQANTSADKSVEEKVEQQNTSAAATSAYFDDMDEDFRDEGKQFRRSSSGVILFCHLSLIDPMTYCKTLLFMRIFRSKFKDKGQAHSYFLGERDISILQTSLYKVQMIIQ